MGDTTTTKPKHRTIPLAIVAFLAMEDMSEDVEGGGRDLDERVTVEEGCVLPGNQPPIFWHSNLGFGSSMNLHLLLFCLLSRV